MTIDISYISLAVGMLLLIIPLYFFRLFSVPLIKGTLTATARMVLQLFLIGLYLRYLFEWNSWIVNILWASVMALIAAQTATKRTKLRPELVFMPLLTGFLVTALIVGLYFLILVLQLDSPFDARYFIPIMGLLMGNMLGVNVQTLSIYYEGLRRERQYYYYLLGNGATHLEAITPFIRKGMLMSFTPCVANMAVMGIVALPGTMIGQILGGSAPGIAVKYQMMIVIITFVASMISLMLTLFLANRSSFNEFGELKKVTKN